MESKTSGDALWQLDFILKVALREKASPDVIPSLRMNINVGILRYPWPADCDGDVLSL